jgi:hypothetical protein
MFEVQFLIPLADNEGNAFTDEVLNSWRTRLIEWFGGYSAYPGQVAGGWMEGGKVYTDENVVYGVAIGGVTDGDKVAKAARYAKILFRQEAIFIRYLGLTEIVS